MRTTLHALFCLLPALSFAVPAHSDSFPVEHINNIQTQSGLVEYRVRMESTRLNDADGNYSADVVNTSYQSTSTKPERPVIFLFNGGPVVPSMYLHMGLLAPYRAQVLTGPRDATIEWDLQENPHTLLDIADLVYVDPPMTGYSRIAEHRDAQEFYGVDADAQQVADFIAQWVQANDRTESPIFLFGESYGTIRAPVTARKLVEDYKLDNVRGVLLFGQAVNMVEYSQRPDNILSYIASLPPLALIAQFHGKSAYPKMGIDTLYQRVQAFNENTYLPALYKGSLISDTELNRVAEQLEAFTGVSKAYYVENRLRISKPQFRQELLRSESKVLGMYDARYAGPTGDDSPTDPSAPLAQVYLDAYAHYRRHHLELETEMEYALRADVQSLADWNWGGNSPFSHFNYAANIDYLFSELPEFRVYVASGHYDLSTTTGGADYLLQQRDWPADKVMLKRYVGGHMAYSDDASAAAMSKDIRVFIQGQL